MMVEPLNLSCLSAGSTKLFSARASSKESVVEAQDEKPEITSALLRRLMLLSRTPRKLRNVQQHILRSQSAENAVDRLCCSQRQDNTQHLGELSERAGIIVSTYFDSSPQTKTRGPQVASSANLLAVMFEKFSGHSHHDAARHQLAAGGIVHTLDSILHESKAMTAAEFLLMIRGLLPNLALEQTELSWLFAHSKRIPPPASLDLRWQDITPNIHAVSVSTRVGGTSASAPSSRPLTARAHTPGPSEIGRVSTPRLAQRAVRRLRPISAGCTGLSSVGAEDGAGKLGRMRYVNYDELAITDALLSVRVPQLPVHLALCPRPPSQADSRHLALPDFVCLLVRLALYGYGSHGQAAAATVTREGSSGALVSHAASPGFSTSGCAAAACASLNDAAVHKLADALALRGCSVKKMKQRCDLVLRAAGGRMGMWHDTAAAAAAPPPPPSPPPATPHHSCSQGLQSKQVAAATAAARAALLQAPAKKTPGAAPVSEASARVWSVDESAEEMRRLASLLLKLAASDSTNAPWRPFDGLFVALSIPARSPAPARVMLVIQNTSSRAAGFFLHFQGLESFEVGYAVNIAGHSASNERRNVVVPGASICYVVSIACEHAGMYDGGITVSKHAQDGDCQPVAFIPVLFEVTEVVHRTSPSDDMRVRLIPPPCPPPPLPQSCQKSVSAKDDVREVQCMSALAGSSRRRLASTRSRSPRCLLIDSFDSLLPIAEGAAQTRLRDSSQAPPACLTPRPQSQAQAQGISRGRPLTARLHTEVCLVSLGSRVLQGARKVARAPDALSSSAFNHLACGMHEHAFISCLVPGLWCLVMLQTCMMIDSDSRHAHILSQHVLSRRPTKMNRSTGKHKRV